MRLTFMVLVIALSAGSAIAHADDLLDARLARFERARRQAPADVAAYMDRHMACWHFAGEEGYDDARHAEIGRAIERLGCATLPADEQALRRKHADSPPAFAGLDAAIALERRHGGCRMHIYPPADRVDARVVAGLSLACCQGGTQTMNRRALLALSTALLALGSIRRRASPG